ncbi:MAG: flagellar biosynthesis protein FlhB [Candidatus Kapaibacteriales bacterium]
MAENKEGQDKTEDATRKRLDDAREKGQVAKSMDMTTAAVILLGGLSVFAIGSYSVKSYGGFMTYLFENSSSLTLTNNDVLGYYPGLLLFLAKILLPILILIVLVIMVSEISQVGLKVAWKKYSELDDFKKIFKIGAGLKRIFFSGRSLFELVKSFFKIFLIAAAIGWRLNARIDELVSLGQRPLSDVGEVLLSISLEVLITVGLVFIIIAVSDYLYQKYKFKEDMKMTKQEVKDESKQMEGDPKIKGRLRQLIRGRLRSLMLKNVEKADVVIANPTHFAVALKYDRSEMDAPKCIAKGLDFMALRIREIAEENDVTIVEDPPLARLLYKELEVDRDIPEEHFKAVAKILAYVYSLENTETDKSYN